ncbi:MAG TPA: 3-mercaptopyruvate sulfurtransferase [Devosia sp.]|nr:3-mercaptopyruvate sulfurtransferase [Devosia sp.]
MAHGGMASPRDTSLVSTDWLADNLGDPKLVVLDIRFNLPGSPTTGAEDYAAGHIAGAHFFDVDTIADTSIDLPHMLPVPAQFAAQVGALGVGDNSVVVVYDGPGLMSSARAWWMFRVFGFERVAILEGGFRKWIAEGRPVSTDSPPQKTAHFVARFHPELVRSKADVFANLETHREQVVDARSAGRFAGTAPEPRPGLRGGHIPGSTNLPFGELSDPATGRVRSDDEIRTLFSSLGVDLTRPVVATCGSGVTSCALAFALHLTGKTDVAIYDGSWSEWAMSGDTPVET